MEPPEHDGEKTHSLLPKPPDPDILTKLIILQADLIYNSLIFLFSPLTTILSFLSQSYHRAEEAKDTTESAVHRFPSKIAILIKKLTFGIVGVMYMGMLMFVVLILAFVLGVGLVRFWVEEPVVVRESLYFDYTLPHPVAVFSLMRGGGDGGDGWGKGIDIGRNVRKRYFGIPVGHSFCVSLALLMPESDFNRNIGVFQLSAELLSAHGDIIARSSQPCMLRFRSLPIRLTRTFLMGVPLLLGISGETQMITINMLKHKEVNIPRSAAIRVSLIPRARTWTLPELYEAEILIKSRLPWAKNLLYRWKWTCYLWMTMYLYILFLVILICCWKPFFRVAIRDGDGDQDETVTEEEEVPEIITRDQETTSSELLRKLQRIRNRRKTILMKHHENLQETVGSSASSITFSREDASAGLDEDTGDSESVCHGGTWVH